MKSIKWNLRLNDNYAGSTLPGQHNGSGTYRVSTVTISAAARERTAPVRYVHNEILTQTSIAGGRFSVDY